MNATETVPEPVAETNIENLPLHDIVRLVPPDICEHLEGEWEATFETPQYRHPRALMRRSDGLTIKATASHPSTGKRFTFKLMTPLRRGDIPYKRTYTDDRLCHINATVKKSPERLARDITLRLLSWGESTWLEEKKLADAQDAADDEAARLAEEFLAQKKEIAVLLGEDPENVEGYTNQFGERSYKGFNHLSVHFGWSPEDPRTVEMQVRLEDAGWLVSNLQAVPSVKSRVRFDVSFDDHEALKQAIQNLQALNLKPTGER